MAEIDEKHPIDPSNFGKYDLKMVNRGNCMLCGKALTEGLFFCKECEKKGERISSGKN